MIRYLYKNLKTAEFKEIDNYRSGCWVYVEDPSEDDLGQLVNKYDLDVGHLDDALDEDEMPRFEVEGNKNYIFTRYIFRDDSLQVTTVPILFIIGDGLFISLSAKKLPHLDKFFSGKVAANTTQRTKLLLLILDQIVNDYDTQLTVLSRQIKATRNRLRVEEIHNRDFINFVMVEDELDDFLGALSPTNSILRRLLTGKHMKLYVEDQDLVEDLLLNNEQSIETCRTSLKTIVNIREAYSTIMGNNLNKTMRQLTVLTVIMTVPTIIGGIWGMNVSVPFSYDPNAFVYINGMIVIVAVGLLIYFRKQHWF